MIWIILVRIAIWLTFFLLIVEGVVAIFFVRWATRLYVRKHRELEVRVEVTERRLGIEDRGKS